MLSPSKPLHATGDAVQCAPASSECAIVEQFVRPSAIQLTLNARPVRGSTIRNGSRLVTGAGGLGDTSLQRGQAALERPTTGVSGAPLIEPLRRSQPRKRVRPSGVRPMLAPIAGAPAG